MLQKRRKSKERKKDENRGKEQKCYKNVPFFVSIFFLFWLIHEVGSPSLEEVPVIVQIFLTAVGK